MGKSQTQFLFNSCTKKTISEFLLNCYNFQHYQISILIKIFWSLLAERHEFTAEIAKEIRIDERRGPSVKWNYRRSHLKVHRNLGPGLSRTFSNRKATNREKQEYMKAKRWKRNMILTSEMSGMETRPTNSKHNTVGWVSIPADKFMKSLKLQHKHGESKNLTGQHWVWVEISIINFED